MAQTPIGAIASVSAFNGKRLKVVVVGEGGNILDVNCRFGHDRAKNASLPNYLPLPDGRRTQGSLWTDGGVLDTAHPDSKLAACTIERLNVANFFYQLPDGSIVMRRCSMESDWKWETGYTSILSSESEYPPDLGTSIVVQPSVLRAGDGNSLTFFYITLNTQEIWECNGTLTTGPWRELEDDESYVSAAQRVILETPPTPFCVQMASYQADQPIFYSMVSSTFKSIVWSSNRARRSYRFEVRGMPGTPIALSGYSLAWSSLNVLFVDITGAVNIGSMRNAFSWVLSKGTNSALGLDVSLITKAPSPDLGARDVLEEAEECPAPCEVVQIKETESTEVAHECADAQPCPSPCPDPCPNPCSDEAEHDEVNEEHNDASIEYKPADGCCGDEPIISDRGSSYGVCSTCDGNEDEDVCSEPPFNGDADIVVEVEQDICELPEPYLPVEEMGDAPFEDPVLSEESTTPTFPVAIPLPEEPALISEDVPLTSIPPSPPRSSSPCLPEPVQEAPIVDSNTPFVDILYERLRFIFKPSGGRYISLQLPARRVDQISSMYVGVSSSYNGFTSNIVPELNAKLSDELFDVAKFVSGPNGRSLFQEYESLLYSLIPNPDTEISRSLNIQRAIILQHLSQLEQSATSTSLNNSITSNEVVDPLRPEANQVATSDKAMRIILESITPQPWDITARINFANVMNQSTATSPTQLNINTGAVALGATQLKSLSQPNTLYAQDISSPTGAILSGESLATTQVNTTNNQRTLTETELMGYLDVKTGCESLHDARSLFRKSGRSYIDTSKLTLPITMTPFDWYGASQTSWIPEELNHDSAVLQSQLDRKLSDMDSLTAQLIPFIRSSVEDYQDLELEVQSLVKKRDDLQRELESEYPISAINLAQKQVLKQSDSNSSVASLLRCIHDTPLSDEPNDRDFDLATVSNRLGAIKAIDRKLMHATRSLTLKRAQETMTKPDGTNMQLRSSLESKILEHQAFIEAYIKLIRASSERYALNLQTSISQVHLPYSNDPRWSIINISTEVPNTTWDDAAVGFGLWAGYEANPASRAESVKLDISFRVSLVNIDRGAWFKSDFMKHSDQFMRLPGNKRWSEWPCDAQTPEEVVERILQGDFVPKGSLAALPAGYLIAKDILIKIHTPEQASGATKETLIKQAATAHGILGFGFAPQASAHGNPAAMHISEHSDGIVFRLPEAQILGYMMQLTPPDLSVEYNSQLVESVSLQVWHKS
ncbi:peptidase M12A family [Rhizoctonia solani]|uniref:Peptidase M12A family n=1 Tax=Rhizoctonia solani TaxID=456999 RepID=A0A8H7IMP0_9AGAM|nr:peptidase M12A family [Rhizoctonia solani]